MVRRTAGFISKRPHKKSRGGCATCKRKKVKCDEVQPACTYCAQRKLECLYPQTAYQQTPSGSDTDESKGAYITPETQDLEDVDDFNSLVLQTPSWLVPAANTSIGQLTAVELELLDFYKSKTWSSVTVRGDEPIIYYLTQDWVPRTSVAHPYLLNTILSISASHSNALSATPQKRKLADIYRQKALTTYNKELQNITNENYETLLLTSMFIQIMVPPPPAPCSDAAMLTWASALLNMSQGVRVLAGLKWAAGFEKLSVAPLFRRELRTLPAPPSFSLPPDAPVYSRDGRIGDTPEHPNPPESYATPPSPIMNMENLPFRPQQLMTASSDGVQPDDRPKPSWQIPAPAFLPPHLMALLKSIAKPTETGPIDLQRHVLVPALHAFSPIFLSLYHFHLTPDLFVRIIAFPTFLTQDFLSLVKNKEPRAMVIIAWWFTFLRLLPNGWWIEGVLPRLAQSISNVVIRSNNKILMDAVEGCFRVVRLAESRGPEVAARGLLDGWPGVNWEHGMSKDVSPDFFGFEDFVDLNVAVDV